MNVVYESIIPRHIDGYERPIYQIKGLFSNNNKSSIEIKITGNAFLYFINEWQYFHVLHEIIGQYEFIKRRIPDLKIYFVSEDEFDLDQDHECSSVIKDLMSIYDIKRSDVIHGTKNKSIKIDNMFIFHNLFNPFVSGEEFKSIGRPIEDYSDPNYRYNDEVVELLNSKFSIRKQTESKRKILVSRRLANNKVKEQYENGQFKGDYKSDSRFMIDIDKVEDYFIDNGYDPVFLEGLSLVDQINLFHNASHIVTVNGTSCYNSIFTEHGSSVFLINIHNRYGFMYQDLFRGKSIQVYEIPPTNYKEGGSIGADKIILWAEKYKELL